MLQELPADDFIRPKGFKVGGHADFQRTMAKVRNSLTLDDVKLGEEFERNAPASDSVEEFMLRFPDSM